MGSSYGGNGQGGGIPSNCGSIFEFGLLFPAWMDPELNDFEIGQEIKLKLVIDKLPRLEVIKILNGLPIGLVPPSYSMLINCIKNGWEYHGTIVKIEGDEIDPKIYIKIEGER